MSQIELNSKTPRASAENDNAVAFDSAGNVIRAYMAPYNPSVTERGAEAGDVVYGSDSEGNPVKLTSSPAVDLGTAAYIDSGMARDEIPVNSDLVKLSIAELESVEPEYEGQSIYLSFGGRSGTFIWTLGDFSAEVAADTLQGVYVASDTVAATVGCWVRIYDGYVHPEWFGATGDYNASSQTGTDNFEAINYVINNFKAIRFSGVTGSKFAVSDQLEISNTTGSRKITTTTSNDAVSIWRHPDFVAGAAGSKSILKLSSNHNYIDGLLIVPETALTGLNRDVDGVTIKHGQYGNHLNRVRVLGGYRMYHVADRLLTSQSFALETRLTHCQGSGGAIGLENWGLDTQFVDLLLQDTTSTGAIVEKGIEGWNLHIIRTDGDGLVINGGDPVNITQYYMDTIEQDGLVINGVGGCVIDGVYVLKNGEDSVDPDNPVSIRIIDSAGCTISNGKTDVSPQDDHAFSISFEGETYCNNLSGLNVNTVNSDIMAEKQNWSGCTGTAGIKNNNLCSLSKNLGSIGAGATVSVSVGFAVYGFSDLPSVGSNPWNIYIDVASRYSTTSSAAGVLAITLSNSAGLINSGVSWIYRDATRHDFTLSNIAYSDRELSFDVTNNSGTAAVYVLNFRRPAEF